MTSGGGRFSLDNPDDIEDPAATLWQAFREVEERHGIPRLPLAQLSAGARTMMAIDDADHLFEASRHNRFVRPSQNIVPLIVQQPDLLLIMATQMPADDFVSLMSCSKTFYQLCTDNLTSIVMACTRARAPRAVRVFSFRFYHDLCVRDPSGRTFDAEPRICRLSPGIRFLRFLEFREVAVREIVRLLAYHGHRMPVGIKTVILKMWHVMDIPDNARRRGILGNTVFWSHKDLFMATFFLVKLDLRLTHPTEGADSLALRSLIMAQRSFHYLREVLMRRRLMNQTQLRMEWVRTYDLHPRHIHGHPQAKQPGSHVLGIPSNKMGADTHEYFRIGTARLQPVDDLIAQEVVKRHLGLERYLEAIISWGYVDDDGKTTNAILEEDDQEEEPPWLVQLSKGVGDRVEPMEIISDPADRNREDVKMNLVHGFAEAQRAQREQTLRSIQEQEEVEEAEREDQLGRD